MLNDGAIDGPTQVRMLVGDNTRFVTNTKVYILVRCLNKIVEVRLISIPVNLLRLEIGFLNEKVLE